MENEKNEINTMRQIYKINEAAKLLGVHEQTLRNWEKKKLVIPLRAGGIRIYMAEHIELCKKIKQFSGKGIKLKGISSYIGAGSV